MKGFILLLLILIAFQIIIISCNQKPSIVAKKVVIDSANSKSVDSKIASDTNEVSTSIQYGEKEEQVLNAVASLKEVRTWQKYLEKETKGKRHLTMFINDTPTVEQPYYFVQVGEDNELQFVPHFNFFVSPDAKQILYLDTVKDDTLTLKQWRQKTIR